MNASANFHRCVLCRESLIDGSIKSQYGIITAKLTEYHFKPFDLFVFNFQIIFEGKVGKDLRGNIAIDDIYQTKGACQPPGKTHSHRSFLFTFRPLFLFTIRLPFLFTLSSPPFLFPFHSFCFSLLLFPFINTLILTRISSHNFMIANIKNLVILFNFSPRIL